MEKINKQHKDQHPSIKNNNKDRVEKEKEEKS